MLSLQDKEKWLERYQKEFEPLEASQEILYKFKSAVEQHLQAPSGITKMILEGALEYVNFYIEKEYT